jgi:hypothetical protein
MKSLEKGQKASLEKYLINGEVKTNLNEKN